MSGMQKSTDKETKGSFLRRHFLWLALPLILLTVAIQYAPTLDHGWSNWDDIEYVQWNLDIRSLNMESLKGFFSNTYVGGYTPLTMASYAWDYSKGELDPTFYHRTNWILHLINTSLVLLVTWSLFRAAVRRRVLDMTQTAINWIAITCTLIFALHPLQVETVCWIAERKGILHSPFYLLAILSHLKAATPEESGRLSSWRWHLVTALMMALSLLSKQTAVTLPVALLLIDIYPLGRLRGSWKQWVRSRAVRDKLPLILVAIAGSWRAITAASGNAAAKIDYSWPERIGLMFWSEIFLLWKFIWPRNLSSWYSLPFDLSSWTNQMILAGAIALSITAVVVVMRKKAPAALWVWLSWFALLLPVSGIIPWGRHATADRYTYLPMIPWLWLVFGTLIPWATKGFRGRAVALTLGTLLVLSTLIIQGRARILVWKDPVSVAMDQIASGTDQIDMPYNNLGNYYKASGEIAKAVENFQKAIFINDRNQRPYFNLGTIAEARNDLLTAERLYRQAIERLPNYVLAYQQLLRIVHSQSRWEDLNALSDEGIKNSPTAVDWKLFKLRALAETNRFQEFDEFLGSLPKSDTQETGVQLIKVERLQFQKHLEEAANTLLGVAEAELNSDWKSSRSVLPQNLERIKRRLDALKQMTPMSPQIALQQARAYFDLGHFDEALVALRQATQDPQNIGYSAFLEACIHALSERKDEAREALSRARGAGYSEQAIQIERSLRWIR